MDFKPISGAWPNSEIAPNSDKFGLVDPHRLLTWVWSTPKHAIPLIYRSKKTNPFMLFLLFALTRRLFCAAPNDAIAKQLGFGVK
jgi:hypothetical protein